MPSNPKTSPWRSTPRARRKSPQVAVTMKRYVHEAMERICASTLELRSQLIARLILEEAARRKIPVEKTDED